MSMQLNEKYDKALRYIDKALSYEDHADVSWINESTLGRWLYIGSKEVIKDLEKECNKTESGRNFFKRIMKEELNRRLKYFAIQLKKDFPEDELIKEELSR